MEGIEPAIASRDVPPIPGLYVFASALASESAENTLTGIAEDHFFSGGRRNQVMLFDGPRIDNLDEDESLDPILDEEVKPESTLPTYLTDLLSDLEILITPRLPAHVASAVFKQPLPRQIILNLYPPGEGISPHVDLPHRYADGILGVALCGGCVMVLRHDQTGEVHHIYLPSHSVYCLTGEARWEWSHGIEARRVDVVRDPAGRAVSIMRDVRVSVTFRWLREGADELIDGAA